MKRYIITSIALCIGFLSFGQNAVDLKLNPEIGKTQSIDMQMKTDVDGPQSVIMDMNMKMQMTPTKKENENFILENAIKTVKVDLNTGMMTMSYNSEEEPKDEMSKMFAAQFSKILNQTITTTTTNKGKTIDVVIPEGMGEGMDKNAFSNISTPLPEKAVKPGESWESSSEVPQNPIVSKINMTSTFREENVDGYIIDIVGKVIDSTAKKIGTVSGVYTLDKKTCLTKSGQIKTTIEAQGAKISSDVTMTVQ